MSAVDVAKTAAMIAAAQFLEAYSRPGLTMVSGAGVKTLAPDRCDDLRPFACAVHHGPQPPERCAVCTLTRDMNLDTTHAWFCEVTLDRESAPSSLHVWKVPWESCREALHVAREFEKLTD